ncbi:MAG: hypothetical protein ABIR70_04815 [Bryobacteraceae bacterium]
MNPLPLVFAMAFILFYLGGGWRIVRSVGARTRALLERLGLAR